MVISGHLVKWNLSCKPKPADKYDDFHHKMSHYAIKISGPALAVDSAVRAQTFKPRQPDADDSVFLYEDTASSRADIVAINDKLKPLRIGIVGLGGTGSYVLDFVAKAPGREIHLFDGDGQRMKSVVKIKHEFVEFIPKERQEGILYISIPYATAVHKCFCGCGLKW